MGKKSQQKKIDMIREIATKLSVEKVQELFEGFGVKFIQDLTEAQKKTYYKMLEKAVADEEILINQDIRDCVPEPDISDVDVN